MKKLLQYINNERNDIRIKGMKSCDFESYDMCNSIDLGSCTGGAKDICEEIDRYGCTDDATDYCTEGDWTTCHGSPYSIDLY